MFKTSAWRRIVYTLWAPFYDLLAEVFTKLRKQSIERLDLSAGQRVLLIGAGTGLDLQYLPRRVEITAIDLTPSMLNRLRKRADGLGLKVDARVMDAQALSFPDAGFDAVILHLILAVVPDPLACAREAGRVLRPGGRVTILDKFLPDHKRAPFVLRVLAPLASCFGTEIDRHLGPILEQAGLEVVRDEPVAACGLFRIVTAAKPPTRE